MSICTCGKLLRLTAALCGIDRIFEKEGDEKTLKNTFPYCYLYIITYV